MNRDRQRKAKNSERKKVEMVMTNSRGNKWMAESGKIREGQVLCVRSDNWMSSIIYSESRREI